MHRRIIGFTKDEDGDWVANLDCFHQQHVRHKPPFINRPWTETGESRQSMIGTTLNCVRCDRLEWPEGMVAQRRTAQFTEQSLPDGLSKDHSTKTGVWGQIHVLTGKLIYTVTEPTTQQILLQAGDVGIIPPQMLHFVTPEGKVQLFIEFYSCIVDKSCS